MRYKKIDSNLFINNRKKLARELKPGSLAVVHANDEMPRNGDLDYPYRQNSDLFYLTGIEQEKTILVLCPDHSDDKKKEVLFLLKSTPELETWQGHKYTVEEARNISGIQTIYWLDRFESRFHDLMLASEYVYINLNENSRFSSEVPYRDVRFARDLRSKFPLHKYERLGSIMSQLRVIKESEEIKLITQACQITAKAFDRILGFLKPGVMEYEVEAEITHEYIRQGASGHSYSPIVASGTNACVLHYIENDKKCKDGDLLLMDFGAEYANYAGDCSRTIPVNGRFTKRQRELYEATLRIFKQAKQMLRPGATISQYHSEVCRLWEEEHIKLGLYTRDDIKKQDPANPMYFKYYMHGTSHFMGLDVHDPGSKDQVIEPGMVLSCEPGLYIPEEGIGIRIENDIMVSDDKPVDLMESIPIEADDIEDIMNR